jgi:RNA 2',3'-cyclic 3'-phosphodiesterase
MDQVESDQVESDGRLFFAVLPDRATAARIFHLAGRLKGAHGFRGKPIRLERLHVSLFFLGSACEPMVRLACDAAVEIAQQPFDLWFDRTISFRARSGKYPFVLTGDRGLDQLKSFRRRLGAALARRGLRRLASREFTPHVTLIYGERQAEEHPIEPIGWTITEFALIHSESGHSRVGSWPLRARLQPQ